MLQVVQRPLSSQLLALQAVNECRHSRSGEALSFFQQVADQMHIGHFCEAPEAKSKEAGSWSLQCRFTGCAMVQHVQESCLTDMPLGGPFRRASSYLSTSGHKTSQEGRTCGHPELQACMCAAQKQSHGAGAPAQPRQHFPGR